MLLIYSDEKGARQHHKSSDCHAHGEVLSEGGRSNHDTKDGDEVVRQAGLGRVKSRQHSKKQDHGQEIHERRQ